MSLKPPMTPEEVHGFVLLTGHLPTQAMLTGDEYNTQISLVRARLAEHRCPTCKGKGVCDRPTKEQETELHMIGYHAGALEVIEHISEMVVSLNKGTDEFCLVNLRKDLLERFNLPENKPKAPVRGSVHIHIGRPDKVSITGDLARRGVKLKVTPAGRHDPTLPKEKKARGRTKKTTKR